MIEQPDKVTYPVMFQVNQAFSPLLEGGSPPHAWAGSPKAELGQFPQHDILATNKVTPSWEVATPNAKALMGSCPSRVCGRQRTTVVLPCP